MAAGGFRDENLSKETVKVHLKSSNNSPEVVLLDTEGNVLNVSADSDPQQDSIDDDTKQVTTDVDKQQDETTKFIENEEGPKKVLVQKYTAIDIVRNGRILRVSVILWFTWSVYNVCLYLVLLTEMCLRRSDMNNHC